MGKYIYKVLIPAVSFFLILSSVTSADDAFPKFDVFTKGGYSLEPGKLRFGRIELHPGFAFESRYESNIFDEADKSFPSGSTEGRTDDFIFTNKPSMGIELQRAPGEIFGFFFDYLGEDEHYLEEGGSQDFFNHRLGGGINLGGPGGRGDLTLGGGWEKRAGGGSRDFDSNIGNRQERRAYNGFANLVYSLSEIFKLTVDLDVEDRKFKGRQAQNVDEYNTGGSFFWQVSRPVAFGVKFNHKFRRYEVPSATNDDSDQDQIYLAMKWEPTSLFSSEIAVGYDDKRYETIKGDDSRNFIYEIDLLYRPVKRTGLHLTASREIVDSTFQNIQSYVLTAVEIGLSQDMGKKFTLLVDASHEFRDYGRSAPDPKNFGIAKTRLDNSVAGSTALVYAIQKWLEAKAKYQYEQTLSNFNGSDFVNHIGLIEIAAKY